MPNSPAREKRDPNRPRSSRMHHPRASRTIRGAFLARPATGRNCSLGRGSPRLGGLCQILATLGNTRFPKKRGFCRPPPLYTYMRTRRPRRRRRTRARETRHKPRQVPPGAPPARTWRGLCRVSRAACDGEVLLTEVDEPAVGPGRRRRRRPCSGANLAHRSARRQARPLYIGGTRLRRHAHAVARK